MYSEVSDLFLARATDDHDENPLRKPVSRARKATSRVRTRSSPEGLARPVSVRVMLKDGRTIEGRAPREIILDEEQLLVLDGVTRAFDSGMNEILTTPLDAAIARNNIVEIEEIDGQEELVETPEAFRPAAGPTAGSAELDVRLRLTDGRTIEGVADRRELFEAENLVVLTRVVHVYDSEMNEVEPNPLDAALARARIMEIEEVVGPEQQYEAPVTEPVPEASPPPLAVPDVDPPTRSEAAPGPVKTSTRPADLLPRDQLAIGGLRLSAAKRRLREARISLVLFGIAALALAALLLITALGGYSDRSTESSGAPASARGVRELAWHRHAAETPETRLPGLSGGPNLSSAGDKLAI